MYEYFNMIDNATILLKISIKLIEKEHNIFQKQLRDFLNEIIIQFVTSYLYFSSMLSPTEQIVNMI